MPGPFSLLCLCLMLVILHPTQEDLFVSKKNAYFEAGDPITRDSLYEVADPSAGSQKKS